MRTKYNMENQQSRQEFAKSFLHSYDEMIKDIESGKIARGKSNFENKLNKWKQMAKEIETDEL